MEVMVVMAAMEVEMEVVIMVVEMEEETLVAEMVVEETSRCIMLSGLVVKLKVR